jgi:hypothetical protein
VTCVTFRAVEPRLAKIMTSYIGGTIAFPRKACRAPIMCGIDGEPTGVILGLLSRLACLKQLHLWRLRDMTKEEKQKVEIAGGKIAASLTRLEQLFGVMLFECDDEHKLMSQAQIKIIYKIREFMTDAGSEIVDILS